MKAEFIRDLCLGFPGVKEEVKWGHDLCFLTGNKMFCITGIEGEFGVAIKVKDEEFEELLTRDGISPAPYLGRYKWIHINSMGSFSLTEWKHYLKQSYEIIKTKAAGKKKRKS